jgi:GNAT superfamily N-acetyltransferase
MRGSRARRVPDPGSMMIVRALRGDAVVPHLADVARLRIEVFRAYPYLYDGDAGYEQKYLATYAHSPDSVFVLAFDGGRVVGASTGIPLAHDGDAFQQPFRARGLDVERVFYFGESVLLPEYRGRGLGHRFFDEREAHARRLGRFDTTAFAAIDRAADDARRPDAHRDNDAFWLKRGYVRQPGMTMRLAWKEVGEAVESEKPLTFWLRALDVVGDTTRPAATETS